MTAETHQKIFAFLQDQIANAPFRTEAYVFDSGRRRRLARNVFARLLMHLRNFREGVSEERWITMFGLRGAGKTTLLAQLYESLAVPNRNKLFLSVDQVVGILGVSLTDVLEVYEEILGVSFERLDTPVFLFLDEVQYEPRWGLLIKTLYDRSKKVFIVTTGSSALALQADADVTRRSRFEPLYPMSFTEYLKLHRHKLETKGLGVAMRDALFASPDARSAAQRLAALAPQIAQYWGDVDPKEIHRYMNYGSLPFMLEHENEAIVYDKVKKTLEKVVSMDIPHITQFAAETVSKIQMVLYAIAESDQLVLANLSTTIGLSRPILTSVLETLERTQTVWRVMPFGSHTSQVRQPSKYLFTSPAFRAMYFSFIGSTRPQTEYKGKLLEDAVGLTLFRCFSGKPSASITYDSAAGGADFIVREGERSLVIEVGFGSKSVAQVRRTMAKQGVNAAYGIVFSQQPFGLSEDGTILRVPLEYFFLL